MSKIFKKIGLFVMFVFFMIFLFSGKTYAATEVETIANKMSINAFTNGNLFTVGIMGNYYQVERYSQDVKIHRKVYLATISDDIETSDVKDNIIQRKYIAHDNIIVGFNGNVPRGYGKTLLYGLGYENFKDDTADTNDRNYKNDCVMSGIIKTLYTTEIVENTSNYYLATNEYQNYDYVCLCLVADIVEAKVTLRQFQKTWFGDQNLWTAHATAFVICNIRETPGYGLH